MGSGSLSSWCAFILSSPRHLKLFPLLDAVVVGPGLQVQRLSTGMFSNYAFCLCFCCILYVRIPKGLKGQDVPSPPCGKTGANGECSFVAWC